MHGTGAKIQRRKRKSDWMNTAMKFDLTTYLCFIGILALHLRDSTYLSSEAMGVSKNISDLTQALLPHSEENKHNQEPRVGHATISWRCSK